MIQRLVWADLVEGGATVQMQYSYSFVLLLTGAACGAGFLGALLGVGAGIFLVPVMVLLLHLPVKIAVACALVSVIATSNAKGSAYMDQRITNEKLAMILLIPTTAGALSGTILMLYLREWVMLLVFAVLLAYVSYTAFSTRNADETRIASGDFCRAGPDRLSASLDLHGEYHDSAAGRPVRYVVNGMAVGMSTAYVAGLASGMLGVGGGVVNVPIMNRYMSVPMKAAIGTGKLMIGITAAVSAIVFLLAGWIHFLVVGPVALGATVGATLGTMVMNRVPSAVLKGLFAVLTIYLAYAMLAKGLLLGFAIALPRLG